MSDKKYYEISQILSYNKKFNLIFGDRGIGKTWAIIKFLFYKFLKDKKTFAYIRTFDKDSNLIKRSAFNYFATCEKVPITYQEGKIFINNELAGYFMGITNGGRGIETHVNFILYDECVPLPGKWYISSEFERLIAICESLGRNDLEKVFLTANICYLYNPYWLNFNVFNHKESTENAVLHNLYSNEDYIFKQDTKNMTLYLSTAINNNIMNIYKDNHKMYIETGVPQKSTRGLEKPYNGKILNPNSLPLEAEYIQKRTENNGIVNFSFSDWKAATNFGYFTYSLFKQRLKYISKNIFF
jgi:hypothetical protein